ncbi:DUF1501 domain-containing protein [Rudanella lutea]|uniref:DUF1501 domain-containing protein n=1 Tax=Rudanella lutea TaxID=451374 RepID=UPI00048A0F3E|nr:DUF1501 domain-containing protein [Rudanella lutea]
MKRRDFIQYAAAGAMTPVVLGGYSARAYGQTAFLDALASVADANDRVLVLVQLNGGNDGLNTVIPLDQMSAYNNLRSNIAIKEDKVLRLTNTLTTGLHPAMTGMRDLFNEGKMSIVHSVSYPSPSQSHFRASDIWFTAANSNQTLTTGWLGRYLDTEFPGYPDKYPSTAMPDPLAVQISYITSTSLLGPSQSMAIAIQNPDTFATLVGDKAAIDPGATANTPAGRSIAFIRQQQVSSVQYAGQIKAAAGKGKNMATYPTSNSLADQLKIVARLIHGGLRTKVYYVSIGGFDTHATQTDATDTSIGAHANLLKMVSDGIRAFMTDLKMMGIDKRVAGMTFSEFGRRAGSNSARGTDHGIAAPVFVFAGEGIKTQFVGKNPSLTDLEGNSIKMQMDFRQVYSALLTDWLGETTATANSVLLRNFEPAPMFRQIVAANEEPLVTFGLYPNPAVDDVLIESELFGPGGVQSVQVVDMTGRPLFVPVERLQTNTYRISVRELPAGTYIVAVETGRRKLTNRLLINR